MVEFGIHTKKNENYHRYSCVFNSSFRIGYKILFMEPYTNYASAIWNIEQNICHRMRQSKPRFDQAFQSRSITSMFVISTHDR